MTEKLPILYDHYKDTCSVIGESVKRRDRLMLYVLLLLSLFSIETLFPSASSAAISGFLKLKYGFALHFDLSALGNVVWFLLLIFTLRYFQVAVFVERQYLYIHGIEETLNTEFGDDIITREGKFYLHNYPAFSTWMWGLYTIIFPTLLLIVSAVKITGELCAALSNGWSFALLLDAIAFILLTISTALYLMVLHRKGKKGHGV